MLERLADVLEVENPAEILRNENGLFEVTSPFGQVFQVDCHQGRLMRVREIGQAKKIPLGAFYGTIWRIRRVENAARGRSSHRQAPRARQVTARSGPGRRPARRKPR
jgi:hypothetical protein